MPLNWLNRFTPGGFRQPREVAEKCNALGDAASAAIEALEARVTQNESDISALDGRVTANEAAILALDGRVTQNELDIAQNASDITALDGRITQNEADIALLQQIIVETRVAFHGAVLRTTSDADSNIGAGYQPLDNFETIAITPRGCTMGLNGEFSFDRIGAWELRTAFNLSHNESNQGRETNLRIFNVTDATPGQEGPIAIARNQPGTNYYNGLPVTIGAGDIGDVFRLEIGGGDTLSSVVWNSKQIILVYLGEVGGLIDPTP